MNGHRLDIQLRWADFDANHHMRHSAYYDLGAMARIDLLLAQGIGESLMREMHIGPVLFKEECTFRKEVRMNDRLYVFSSLKGCRRNGGRFSFHHAFYKNEDQLCAELTVWGDWMDLNKRKLTTPNETFQQKLLAIPRHESFQFI